MAALGKLQCIPQQVAHDLAHAVGVATDGAQGRKGDVGDDRRATGATQLAIGGGDAAKQKCRIEVDALDQDLAFLDLGQIEDVAQQVVQRLRRA
jgi:hypothetical protein